MGGFGSGRWQRGKDLTEEYLQLDVRKLKRDGLLAPGQYYSVKWERKYRETKSINIKSEPDQVILSYSHRNGNGKRENKNYPVKIEWTPCNYGGKRPWFICPTKTCGRRVAILYGGDIFVCRHCLQLAYASQRENDTYRKLSRAQKIRKKLGGSANMLEPFPQKPKGMHWDTYWWMEDQHYAFYRASLIGMAEQIGMKIDI